MNDMEQEHQQDHKRERGPGSTSARAPLTVEEPSGPAVGSLVWGLVTLAVAGLVGVHELTDLRVDLSLALPIGMVALGVLLVVGAVVTGLRRQGRDRSVHDRSGHDRSGHDRSGHDRSGHDRSGHDRSGADGPVPR